MKRESALARHPQNRWHALLASGDPRAVTRQCTATSKRTGKQCRNAARRGHRVCGFHGVRRSDRETGQMARRRALNVDRRHAVSAVGERLSEGLFQQETLSVFRQVYAGRVREKHLEEFMLALDRHLAGETSTADWRRILQVAVRSP